jgi:phosphoglycolate phosphatase
MGSIFNDLARDHGFKVLQPHEFELYRNLTHRDLLAKLEIPMWKLPAVMTSMRRRMAENVGGLTVFQGIPEMLRGLSSAGVKLGIVSSNSPENVQAILGTAAAQRIEFYRCGASMFGKAAKLRSVLRKGGVPASESLYVGDELRDLEAARKVGMAFGAVTWGQHERSVFAPHNPDEVFANVEDIAAKVLGHTAEISSS